jgi:hypothetical protein
VLRRTERRTGAVVEVAQQDRRQLICSQTPLGPGWEKAYGPFRDARCEKLIVVR